MMHLNQLDIHHHEKMEVNACKDTYLQVNLLVLNGSERDENHSFVCE